MDFVAGFMVIMAIVFTALIHRTYSRLYKELLEISKGIADQNDLLRKENLVMRKILSASMGGKK